MGFFGGNVVDPSKSSKQVSADLVSLVFSAASILKASFVIEDCLRPPGSLSLPTYE